MFTVDANRCPSCSQGKECPARKLIIPALSRLVNDVNEDPAVAASPAQGIIVFVCKGE